MDDEENVEENSQSLINKKHFLQKKTIKKTTAKKNEIFTQSSPKLLKKKESIEDQEESNYYPSYHNSNKDEIEEANEDEDDQIENDEEGNNDDEIEEDNEDVEQMDDEEEINFTEDQFSGVINVLSQLDVDLANYNKESLLEYLKIMEFFITGLDPFKTNLNEFITEKILKLEYNNLTNQNPSSIAESLGKRLLFSTQNLYYRVTCCEEFNWNSEGEKTKNQEILQKLTNLKISSCTLAESYYNWFLFLWSKTKGKFQSPEKNLLECATWYPWVDLKKETSFEEEFRIYCLFLAKKFKLCKYGKHYFSPKYSKKGYYTYSYQKFSTIEQFVKEKCTDGFHQSKIQHGKAEKYKSIKTIIESLEECADIETPELEFTRHLFSFQNGILNTWTGGFISYHSAKSNQYKKIMNFGFNNGLHSEDVKNVMPTLKKREQVFKPPFSTTACFNFIDTTFNSSKVLKTKWQDIKVDCFEKIFDHQKWSEEIKKMFWVCYGRLFFGLKDYKGENMNISMWIRGEKNSGKTTIINPLFDLFPIHTISLLMNKINENYAINDLVKNGETAIIIGSELSPKGFKMDFNELKQMIGGERVQANKKYNETYQNKVTCPIIATCNEMIIFKGEDIESWAKRTAIFEMPYSLKEVNIDINYYEKFVKPEIPAILYKATEAYKWFVDEHPGVDFWAIAPPEMKSMRDQHMYKDNPFIMMIKDKSEKFLKFGNDLWCGLEDLNKAFNRFCKARNYSLHVWEEKLYKKPLEEAGLTFDPDMVKAKEKNGTFEQIKGIIFGCNVVYPTFINNNDKTNGNQNNNNFFKKRDISQTEFIVIDNDITNESTSSTGNNLSKNKQESFQSKTQKKQTIVNDYG